MVLQQAFSQDEAVDLAMQLQGFFLEKASYFQTRNLALSNSWSYVLLPVDSRLSKELLYRTLWLGHGEPEVGKPNRSSHICLRTANHV